MNTAQLSEMLVNPNRWWRLHAQRLLLERQDQSIVPTIRQQFAKAESPYYPPARSVRIGGIRCLGRWDRGTGPAGSAPPASGTRIDLIGKIPGKPGRNDGKGE